MNLCSPLVTKDPMEDLRLEEQSVLSTKSSFIDNSVALNILSEDQKILNDVEHLKHLSQAQKKLILNSSELAQFKKYSIEYISKRDD